MDARIKHLLTAYELGTITGDGLLASLPSDVQLTKEYVDAEINAAINGLDVDELDRAVKLLWVFEDHGQLLDILHQLVLTPHHYQHQYIVRSLQLLGNPLSVPVLRAALETNLDYLAYTGSKRRVIARWFSWALYDIGTSEAIQTIQEFAEIGKKGIRKEMRYRLSKL